MLKLTVFPYISKPGKGIFLEETDIFSTPEDWKSAAGKKKEWEKKNKINKLPGQYVGGRIQSLIWQVYVSTSSQSDIYKGSDCFLLVIVLFPNESPCFLG